MASNADASGIVLSKTIGAGLQDDASLAPPRTDADIRRELDEMGIDIMRPESRKEEAMAEALESFSNFVLEEEKAMCQSILDENRGDSVGELQGGSLEHSIYRVLITDDEDEAAARLLGGFHSSKQGRRYASILTVDKLTRYMLGMCERRSQARCCRKYKTLGNFMFILSFGPVGGQVRHIDSMVPNLQLCLYMSRDCPSTIVYSMDGPPIMDSKMLIEHWGENHKVPELLKSVLEAHGSTPLKEMWHTRYFSYWDTINTNLMCFGKLYQAVSFQSSLRTDPGTMLVAGGNEVHAGPPTMGPRMFAFAIGIPEENGEEHTDEDNDGEVQYNPASLHVDACCILFGIMEFEYSERREEWEESKRFLLGLLVAMLRDNPDPATHAHQLSDDRAELRFWLEKLARALEDREATGGLLGEAVESSSIFFSPDACNKKRGRRKNRRTARQR